MDYKMSTSKIFIDGKEFRAHKTSISLTDTRCFVYAKIFIKLEDIAALTKVDKMYEVEIFAHQIPGGSALLVDAKYVNCTVGQEMMPLGLLPTTIMYESHNGFATPV